MNCRHLQSEMCVNIRANFPIYSTIYRVRCRPKWIFLWFWCECLHMSSVPMLNWSMGRYKSVTLHTVSVSEENENYCDEPISCFSIMTRALLPSPICEWFRLHSLSVLVDWPQQDWQMAWHRYRTVHWCRGMPFHHSFYCQSTDPQHRGTRESKIDDKWYLHVHSQSHWKLVTYVGAIECIQNCVRIRNDIVHGCVAVCAGYGQEFDITEMFVRFEQNN